MMGKIKQQPTLEIKDIHSKILAALSKHQFLTVPHMKKMGLCSERYLRKKLKELQTAWNKPLIGHIRSSNRGGGRKPYYYHLTKFGGTIATNVCGLPFDRIKLPGRYPQISGDYDHRYQQIDFVIQLYAWAAYNSIDVEMIEHYFERTKGSKKIESLESKTRMYLDGMQNERIEPDAVIVLGTPKGKKMYLFELHRGHDSGRIVNQLETHKAIIKKGIAMQKYDFERNNRVIVLCEKRQTLLGAMKKLQADKSFEMFSNYFLFKHLEGSDFSTQGFGKGRLNISGEVVDIY